MSDTKPLDQIFSESLASLSLPDVYLRLCEVIDSEDASMADVAEVLQLDPALATRVLRIANSAFYGFSAQIDTVTRAASVLGMQKIHDLTLAASASKALESLDNPLMDLNIFWYRSVHCGFMAKQIGEAAGMAQTESLFVRGLLHDIGHLVLFAKYPDQCRQALGEASQGLEARLSAEQMLIGIDGMQLAAELSRIWKLPQSFIETFDYLMHPEMALDNQRRREVAMLHIAAQFSSGIDYDMLAEDVINWIRPEIWDLAGLPRDAGAAAMDASNLEMVDAMYRVLSQTA